MTTPVMSAASSPNRGSAMYFSNNRSMGSRRTSSRPARAIRSPSRCISSCIRENVVVGGTFYNKMCVRPSPQQKVVITFLRTESRAAEYLKFLSSLSYSLSFLDVWTSTRCSPESPFTLCWGVCREELWFKLRSARIAGASKRLWTSCDTSLALVSRLRTDSVPSDIPPRIWVSSG